jgi:hypothetical protein
MLAASIAPGKPSSFETANKDKFSSRTLLVNVYPCGYYRTFLLANWKKKSQLEEYPISSFIMAVQLSRRKLNKSL